MVVNISKRVEFGQFFRVMLAKHNIRQVDIADVAGCSRSFISGVISGAEIMTEEQYNHAFDLLAQTASESDLAVFARKYMEARSNIDMMSTRDMMMSIPVMDRMILKKAKKLTDDQKEILIELLDKVEIGNHNKMGEWADRLLGVVKEDGTPYAGKTPEPVKPVTTKSGAKKTYTAAPHKE